MDNPKIDNYSIPYPTQEESMEALLEGLPTYLYDPLPVAVLLKNTKHQMIYANPAAVKWSGKGLEAEVLVGWNDLFSEDTRKRIAEEECWVVKHQATRKIEEIPYLNKDGCEAFCSLDLFPIVLPNGQMLIGEKITLSEKSHNKTEKQKKLSPDYDWTPLIENSLDGVIVFDLKERKFLAGNKKILKLFNCPSQEVFLASTPQDFFPEFQPDGRPTMKVFEEALMSIASGESKTFLVLHQAIDGSDLYTEVSGFKMSGKDPNICFVLFKEVTALRKAKQELEKSLHFFQKIIDNIYFPVFAKDTDLRYTMVNQAFVYSAKKTREEILGKRYEDVFDFGSAISNREEDEILLAHKGSLNFEWTHKTKKNKIHNLLIQKRTFDNEKKEVEGIVGVVFDLTPVLKARKELEQKNAELQRYADSNSELENFAYFASHDLKEPLRTIGNFTQLLQKRYADSFDATGKEFMNFVVSSVSNMNRLIDDMLTYSRVNAEEEARSLIHFPELVDEVVMNVQESLSRSNATFQRSNLPDELFGDRTKLTQLFQNLISNAIKFKKPDVPPVIALDYEEEEDFWKFKLSDNGIGIKKEAQGKIFDLFKKLHSKQEYEGTGIGLALCHKIVEQHEGKIYVESEFGEGTTFYFTIKKRPDLLKSKIL